MNKEEIGVFVFVRYFALAGHDSIEFLYWAFALCENYLQHSQVCLQYVMTYTLTLQQTHSTTRTHIGT